MVQRVWSKMQHGFNSFLDCTALKKLVGLNLILIWLQRYGIKPSDDLNFAQWKQMHFQDCLDANISLIEYWSQFGYTKLIQQMNRELSSLIIWWKETEKYLKKGTIRWVPVANQKEDHCFQLRIETAWFQTSPSSIVVQRVLCRCVAERL
jgi:hypothetical protein